MKKIFYILLFAMMINAQDIAGTYKMTGIYTLWQYIARQTTELTISDIHDLGLTIEVSTISAGQTTHWISLPPMGGTIMSSMGIYMYVTFNEDGTGSTSGYYPHPTTHYMDDYCFSSISLMPSNYAFTYQSDLNSGSAIPYTSIAGPLSYQSPFMGETAGSLGCTDSDFFPNVPFVPFNPTLCDGMGNCFDLDLTDLGGDIIVGGDPLPGVTGAYVLKGDLPSFLLDQGNENSDLYIEYFFIDGVSSMSGLGFIVGEDEDGDGTDFDRIGSLDYINGTYLDPLCGFNYPIFGDVT